MVNGLLGRWVVAHAALTTRDLIVIFDQRAATP